ncbi:MAG: hypothetical protein QME42_00360 [bacterium]|nr:hypothetical protein [bacterium]
MKIIPDKRLFWFLKEGITLDSNEPSVLDMYVQQVITRGKTEDVKVLLRNISLEQFRQVFMRIKHFLPVEVKMFWEDFIGNH